LVLAWIAVPAFVPVYAQRESQSAGPNSTLIVRNVTLIDSTGSPARGPVDIIIKGDTIQ
jgi:hypothetical protein